MSKLPLRMSASVLAVLFACFAFGAGVASAQSASTTGQIVGTVRDTNGAAVPNATVTVSDASKGLTQTYTTNDEGGFSATNLPPGDYTVTVNAQGFGTLTQSGYKVEVGSSLDAPLVLQVNAVTEEILVTSAGVETTQVQTPTVLNQTAISELPINGRRFIDFVNLTPTADQDPVRSQISLVGQRGINANVQIDGADYNNPFFGGYRGGERAAQAFGFPQSAVREFQVVASGYNAEFGRSTGGVVNVVTKSGTNDIRGSAFYLVRPSSWAHRNAFGQVAAPTQHQYGGAVGGPIMKNKFFYFFSIEQQKLRQQRAVLFPNLISDATVSGRPAGTGEAFDFFRSLEGPYTQTNDATALLGRVDYNFSDTQLFNVRYNYGTNEALNAVTAGTSLSPTTDAALSNNGTEGNSQHTVAGQLTSFFSPTVVNELRAQYSRENRPRTPNELSPLITPALGSVGTVSFLPTTQYDYRIQFSDNVTHTRGAHTWKFGGEFNYTFADQFFAFRQTGNFSFSGASNSNLNALRILSLGRGAGLPASTLDPANRFDDPGVTYRRNIGNALASMDSKEFAFFGQDSWRITPNFTLNFGLRYEAQIMPKPDVSDTELTNLVRNAVFPAFPNGRIDPAVIPNQMKQFAPRVGFAWDPWKDGKTVFRGYSGIYYARTPLLTLAGPLNNFRNPPGDVTVQLSGFTTTTPGTPCANLANPGCPNTIYEQFLTIGIDLNTFPLTGLPILTPAQVLQIAENVSAAQGRAFNRFAGLQLITVGDQLKNPRSFQAGLGFEREVSRGLTLGITFDHVVTTNLNRNRDINLPFPTLRANDQSQRPNFNRNNRPISVFGTGGVLRIREASAHSRYDALTLRAQFRRSWGQFDAFYTASKNLDDDSTERDATFIESDNTFDFQAEYGPSRLDRTHQFVFNTVLDAPFGFQFSSTGRFRSGTPVDVFVGRIIAPAGSGLTDSQFAGLVTLSGSTSGDSNNDGAFQDRPYIERNTSIGRNAFRNRPTYNVDIRLQRDFRFGENMRLSPSFEVFNVFKFKNIEFPQQSSLAETTIYGNPGINERTGQRLAPSNPNFFRIRDAAGNYRLDNRPGQPLAMQLGIRFEF
jgi:hypothetical protein